MAGVIIGSVISYGNDQTQFMTISSHYASSYTHSQSGSKFKFESGHAHLLAASFAILGIKMLLSEDKSWGNSRRRNSIRPGT